MIVDVDEEVAALERWIRALGRFGSIEVLDVAMSFDGDWQDKWALFIDLTLADPPADEETWPYDELWALEGRIDEKARELRSVERWYVRLHSLSGLRRAAENAQNAEDLDDEEDW